MKFLFSILFMPFLTYSQSDVPLTLRAQFNGSYGYTIIGNTMNEFDNWQLSPPPPCEVLTESSATLNLQPNQTIVAAYLYWGGIGDGTFDSGIQLNGISYSATQIFVTDPFGVIENSYFNSFCDVTNQFIDLGNTTYTFSDLDLNPIIGNYCSNAIHNAGWHIVVIYFDLSLPSIQLNVYDGNAGVSNFFNNGTTLVNINNLNVVDTQNAQFSYVALNGSPNLFFNESVLFNGNVLSNALNPANNPFNGTNSFTESTTNWNQDIDTFDISNFINIGDTEATITLNSTFIRFLQTIITSIPSELPDATVKISDVSGQEICNNRDLTVDYTVSNTNSNAVLPSNVPVSFYANDVFLQTVNTNASIPIDGSLALQTTVNIPVSIPNPFTLRVVVDNDENNNSSVAESNENNNEATHSITFIEDSILPTFSIPISFCENANVPSLPNISDNGISGSWFPSVISNQSSDAYVFTPDAEQCALPFTLNVSISNNVLPTFSIPTSFCENANVPSLPTISDNGISGSWFPSVISNQNNDAYVFTPDANQCALPFSLNVSISNNVLPTFSIPTSFCENAAVPILPTISNNGISGSWFPSVISNQNSDAYLFTPDAVQCALPFSLKVSIVPFSTTTSDLLICLDDNANAVLPVVLNTGLNRNLYSFTWFENNLPLSASNESLSVSNPGIYEVLATRNTTGCSERFVFNVEALQPIAFTVDVSDDFAPNQFVTIFASGGSGNYLYSFNNLPFQRISTFEATNSGEVLVVVKDENGCYETTKRIPIWNYPKFFTPNGDGLNDSWGIKTRENIFVYIYDRYGKLIKNLKNAERWDGTFNDRILPATDYWFVLYYDDKIYKSHFSLVR